MTVAQLQKRVEALEAEVAALKAQAAAKANGEPRSWLDGAGAFKDDPAFDEIVRLGREWRESTKPRRKKPASRGKKNVRA